MFSPADMNALYSVMQSVETKLGGGEGVEGIYGSITQSGFQRIMDCMVHSCGLDSRSVLVDIGAGLGRPLLHALLQPGVRGALGVEVDRVKVAKARAFSRQVCDALRQRHLLPPLTSPPPTTPTTSGTTTTEAAAAAVATTTTAMTDSPAAAPAAAAGCASAARRQLVAEPLIRCCPVERLSTLEPATHAYSFWEGVPEDARKAFGRLFVASQTLKAVAVVQRGIRGKHPSAMMQEAGFGPLLHVSSMPVKMCGSGRSFTAYIFVRPCPGSMAFYDACRAAPALEAAAGVSTDGVALTAGATSSGSDSDQLDLPGSVAWSPATAAAAAAAAAASLLSVASGVSDASNAPLSYAGFMAGAAADDDEMGGTFGDEDEQPPAKRQRRAPARFTAPPQKKQQQVTSAFRAAKTTTAGRAAVLASRVTDGAADCSKAGTLTTAPFSYGLEA